MPDQSTSSTVSGLLIAITTVVVPAALWWIGFHPTLMLGAAAGGAMRLLTDGSLTWIRTDPDAEGTDQFEPEHMPMVFLAVLLQFGTLAIAVYVALGGNVLATGYAGGMGASYLLGLIMYAFKHRGNGGSGGEPDVESENGSEWRFDIEDLPEE